MNKTFSQLDASSEIIGSVMTERMVPGVAAKIFNSSTHTLLVKVASGSSPGDMGWETAYVKASVPNTNNDSAMLSIPNTPLTVMTYKKSPFTWDNSSAFMDSAVVQLQVGSPASMAHSNVTLTLDSRPTHIRGPRARVVRSTAQSTCTRCWLVLKFFVPSQGITIALDILNTSWFEKPIRVYFLNGKFSGSKPVFQQNFTVFPLNLTDDEDVLNFPATPNNNSGVESKETSDTSTLLSRETPDNTSVTATQEELQNEHFLPGTYKRLFVNKRLVKPGSSYFFIEHTDNKSSIHTTIRMFQCYTRNPYTGQWSSNNVQWKILPLKDNLVEHKYMYLISFTTGLHQHAGTESNAFFHLQFEKGNTGARKLDNGYYKGFDRADTRTFIFSIPSYLGKPMKIRIWHDDSGKRHKGSWFVDEIRLFDIQLDEV
uniref:PLAT domain-containing protein n=1 Tax=Eptatretus burgeri TaxID=7764 RepID=A0A8C4PW83_EPTBU